MKFNGLMIDCSRLIERHEYYFELLDFMAEWGMNTLLFHFSDDFGCSIKLPGFEELAAPNAFSVEEVKALVAKSEQLGIDIIPEIETFGHTRYITDHCRYAKLRSMEKTDSLSLNALNPFHDESLDVARLLINAVAELFTSPYIHIGCDEVDLGTLPEKHGVAPDVAWTTYVNNLISLTHDTGKYPMIWADHLAKSDSILNKLRKDVILVDWRYSEEGELGTDSFNPDRYRNAGFKDVLLSPAIAMFYHRWLPNCAALQNVETCIELAAKHDLAGAITTIWIPFRYLRETMYYGIAFSAYGMQKRGNINRDEFNAIFSEKVFGTSSSKVLQEFLDLWPDLLINYKLSEKLIQEKPEFSDAEIERLQQNYRNGAEALALANECPPIKNNDIWNAMVLATKAVWLCSYCYYALHSDDHHVPVNHAELINSVKEFMQELDKEWNRTRYPDDPQKLTPRFTGWDEQYNLVFFNHLLKMLSEQ